MLFAACFLTALAVRAYSDEPNLFAPISNGLANTNLPETAERATPDRQAVERAAWTADENKTPTLAPTPATTLPLTQPNTAALTPAGTQATSTEPTLQVRVAWGGGTERIWQGRISLTSGTIADPRLLGVEADESGTIWLQDDHLEIRGRSPRAYDGVDFAVNAPLTAKLKIEFAAREPDKRPATLEIPLSDLLREGHNGQLDEQGNRVLVRRAPGDALRVKFNRDSLVFSPGEEFPVEIQPQLPNLPSGTVLHVKASLAGTRGGKALWSKDLEIKLGTAEQPASAPLSISIPAEEGVYDLTLEATERGLLRWNKPLVDRKLQFVVVGSQPLALPAANRVTWSPVTEIDPASPKAWDRLASWPGLNNFRKMPLNNGRTATWQHSLGPLVQLAPSSRNGDLSWEAYPLAINKPGTPHILEIDFPSDVTQTLGISIMEPNAAGALVPIEIDSGVEVPDEASPTAAKWLHHRIVFWPRTKSPLILFSNRRETSRAVYGKIRILAGPAHLPRLLPDTGDTTNRLLATYLHKPLFPQNFSASEALDTWSGRSLTDWQTYLEGGSRLIEHLHYTGQNGLMLGVLSDGSAIYPTRQIDSSPRYDTGTFFDQGLDPVRKDGMELVLRLCDREGIQCIPTLQFAAPLRELETLSRQGTDDISGIRWIGADGTPLVARQDSVRGLAPYYNVLDERVQAAMMRVIREAVERAAKHSSFAGLSLEMNADGYAILPGDEWGFDDHTIGRFSADTKIVVPGAGPERFGERARFLLGKQRNAWLEWRAEQMTAFHKRIAKEITTAKPGTKLYLCGMNLLGAPGVQSNLRPTLPTRVKPDEALRVVGLRTENYRDLSDIVFPRPQHIAVGANFSGQAADLEFNRATEVDRRFATNGGAASLIFHEPQKNRLTSFDAKSPFDKNKSFTWQVAQISTAEQGHRQNFVHALATLDVQTIFDGGWLVPLGQETALREFTQAFRRLPAVRFENVADATQPIVIRTHTNSKDGKTFIYLVNDSPWSATVRLQVEMPSDCRLDDLGGNRRLETPTGTSWTVELAPYDLAAAVFSSSQVKFTHPQTTVVGKVEVALDQRIRDLTARTAALAAPTPLNAPLNANFETPEDRGGKLPGWECSVPNAMKRERDSTRPGEQAVLKIANPNGVLSVRSEPFESPQTGRLAVSVGLRIENVEKQPQLRLAVEGILDGKPYYRFASVGAGDNIVRIGRQFSPYVFQIDDLPTTGLTQLRVRFDMLGPGDVWIDDVRLYDLAFSEVERIELTKIITSANISLQSGKTSDCARTLEGYWPRYLTQHVPLVQTAASPAISKDPASKDPSNKDATASKPTEKTAEKPGAWDRMRKVWPF